MNSDDRRRRPGDRIVRRPRQHELEPVRIHSHRRRRISIPASTSALLSLTLGFLLLISLGTIALMVPAASTEAGGAPFITALFTATSAVCVTGLVVVESATYWTHFGQGVIIALMFLGGLGIMTAGILILVLVVRRITLNQRLVVRETMGGMPLGSVVSAGRYILIFAVAVQAAGFAALFLYLLLSFPVGQAAWTAMFHSVSAFNNAGFTIFLDSDSLSAFQSDHVIIWIHGVLIVLGALSLPVILEVIRQSRLNRWSLDTRMVVIGTLAMWGAGLISMLVYEIHNPATLGGMGLGDQISNALFQSITSRTAGFSTIDYGASHAGNDVIFMILMFIGGASGSTAGGIKINTFMVLVIAGIASIQGRTRAEFGKREIPAPQILRAIAVFLLAAFALVALIVALGVTEMRHLESGRFVFLDLLFEATSAFGTVGLSRGITPDLSDPGKVLITIGMYVGRLGPLTLALGLALRERRAVYRFAEERVRIG
ncbi:MAG: potassium transporter TrkG [Dehalococcoidia bacterium]